MYIIYISISQIKTLNRDMISLFSLSFITKIMPHVNLTQEVPLQSILTKLAVIRAFTHVDAIKNRVQTRSHLYITSFLPLDDDCLGC